MIKKLFNSKIKLGIGVIVILMLVLGLSYGTFLIGTDNYKVSELLIAELNYGITITKDDASTCTINGTKVTTPASTECFITIQISSVNPIDSRYALAYKNETGNATVQYTDKTQWKSEGVIEDYNSNYTRKVRVVINNTGKTEQAITDFKVFGGYKFNSKVSIDLNNGYVTIPGTYTESIEAGNNRLVDIIEKDTNCLTSTSKECLYGGGVITNYLQYPTSSNTSDNLWRITGSYDLDGTTYAKVVYNNNYDANINKDNIQTTLSKFYNTLDKPNEVIQETNKFNCTKEGCTASTYSNMGLLSVYEYEQAGGYDSYLGNQSNWFALDSGTIKNITPNSIEEATSESGIRPTAYLQTDVTVTGKGTLEDPYRISPKGDINLVAYTYNGAPTKETFKSLIDSDDKTIDSIDCTNGTVATWNRGTRTINITEVHIPDYCTINFIDEKTFLAKLIEDNKEIGIREDFSKPFNELGIKAGLYKEDNEKYLEEDGKLQKAVYYFVGDVENNWVKFGKENGEDLWWRVIRTNEDGSVRLLYAGKGAEGHASQEGHIGSAAYNSPTRENPVYVGYKYGSPGSLENNRKNTTNSTMKKFIDAWYEKNFNGERTADENNFKYGTYLSRTAVYCNDRANPNYSGYGYMLYAAYKRLVDNKRPSFKCGNDETGTLYESYRETSRPDRFTGINSSDVGNQELGEAPIALITADEIVYAGGIYGSKSENTYYYQNSNGESVTKNYSWYTMTPINTNSDGWSNLFDILGSGNPGFLSIASNIHKDWETVRPVLSLKSCVGITGTGTTTDPYIPSIDAACAAADN